MVKISQKSSPPKEILYFPLLRKSCKLISLHAVISIISFLIVLLGQNDSFLHTDCVPDFPFMCSVERVNPKDPTNENQNMEHTRWRFRSMCYEVGTYKLTRCSYETELEVLDDQCGPYYGGACGNILDQHVEIPTTPPIIGGLGTQQCTYLDNHMYYENEFPVLMPYFGAYCGGETMLRVKVTQVAKSLENRPFLTPPCELKKHAHIQAILTLVIKT